MVIERIRAGAKLKLVGQWMQIPATGISIDSMQVVDSDRVTPGDVHDKRDKLVKSLECEPRLTL